MSRTPAATLALAALLALPGAVAAPSPSPETTLDAAREAESSGDTAKAASLYGKAVKEATALGESHELYATTLFAAALFHELSGTPAEAEAIYRTLVGALERTGAAEVVSAYELLAELLCERGELAEVKELFTRSIAAQARAGGSPESPEIANSYRDLGRCLAKGGRAAEAAQAFDLQLRMREAIHGAGTPGTVPALMESAQHHAEAGDRARAVELLERALAAVKGAQGAQKELLAPFEKQIADELAKLR